MVPDLTSRLKLQRSQNHYVYCFPFQVVFSRPMDPMQENAVRNFLDEH